MKEVLTDFVDSPFNIRAAEPFPSQLENHGRRTAAVVPDPAPRRLLKSPLRPQRPSCFWSLIVRALVPDAVLAAVLRP